MSEMEQTTTHSFEDLLKEALLGLDESGRLEPSVSRRLRDAALAAPLEERLAVGFEPERALGAFESLPEAARRAIVDAIVDDDRAGLRGHEMGAWHPTLLRLLWRVKHWSYRRGTGEGPVSRSLRQLSDVAAFGARKGPARALHAMHRSRLARNGRGVERPDLASVLALAGIEPRSLAVCYARELPQLEPYRAYWHDARRNVSVGVVIGIDLLPTPEGCWYIESNLDLAQRPERSALYERDPAVWNLLEFTRSRGFSSLVLLDNNSSGVDPDMARQYLESARECGIELSLVDRINVPGSPFRRSYGIPAIERDDTLVVRLKSYPTSLDTLFNLKRASYRALDCYRRATDDPELLLPASSSEPVLSELDADDPFPNVVYKLPELDQARGVYFLKATSADHARALAQEAVRSSSKRGLQERVLHAFSTSRGIYQQFVKPSLLERRRPYIIRAHTLVSPAGVELLSAHRVVSGTSVPQMLAPGIVHDPGPYLVNFSAQSHYELVPDEEQARVERAAKAAGRGLAWAVQYGWGTCT